MFELTADNAAHWLSTAGLPSEGPRFTELGGGISNKVILAEGTEFRAVLKQSLGQLHTATAWYSDRTRIFREAAAMTWLRSRKATGHIPAIVAEDRSNFTIAMEAAPAGSEMWKSRLFAGEFDRNVARRAGEMLGSLIAVSWNNEDAKRIFGDQSVFDQLRIDPYYRHTALQQPDAADYIGALIRRSASRRVSLVHGDWSPKNLLVSGDDLWAIDWEVIHYGDPSFDAGFLLNHLLMKSLAMPQHRAPLSSLAVAFVEGLSGRLPADAHWVVEAALEHLPALLLARVDGKSPAEYLDSGMRAHARAMALDLMRRPVTSVEELFQ